MDVFENGVMCVKTIINHPPVITINRLHNPSKMMWSTIGLTTLYPPNHCFNDSDSAPLGLPSTLTIRPQRAPALHRWRSPLRPAGWPVRARRCGRFGPGRGEGSRPGFRKIPPFPRVKKWKIICKRWTLIDFPLSIFDCKGVKKQECVLGELRNLMVFLLPPGKCP